MAFQIKQCILVNNDCYKKHRSIKPIGVMVHSTGANNPNLSRYLAPDDGIIGKNKYGNHWNQGGSTKCVHGFIGKGVDGNVYTYQTLPWDIEGWHSGGGANGSANRLGYIGFEICEDDLSNASYLKECYEQAAQLTAYLVKTYNISMDNVICHIEGHNKGIASNHGDVMHWWPKHGLSMDTFRARVKEILGGTIEPTPEPEPDPKPEVDPTPIKSYLVRVTADALNYRSGPGTNYKINGVIRDKGTYTIVEEKNGWGKLKSGAGWISLKYTEKRESGKPNLTRILKLVSPNMRGEDVRWAQERLNRLGYNCGTADGIFGSKTDKAVKAFQKAKGLSQDGDIGPKTWAEL